MTRAERLFDLQDRLQATTETTVGALARDLGVSERTMRRDLATLRGRGMPITGATGRFTVRGVRPSQAGTHVVSRAHC